jgi:hypothetical protein
MELIWVTTTKHLNDFKISVSFNDRNKKKQQKILNLR